MSVSRLDPVLPSSRRYELALDRLLIWAGDLVVPAAIAILTVLVGAVAVLAGFATAGTIAALLASGVVNTVAAFLIMRLRRHNAVLSEVTLSYIATGNRGLLDELLGRLIGGRFRRRDFQPSEQLFRTLEELAGGTDYELKRRLVEALPGLATIDQRRTVALMHRMRGDWDIVKWRGDLRRRTVEALVATRPSRSRSLLCRIPNEDLVDLLRIRDDDEIWTAFAIVEVSQVLAGMQRGEGKFDAADATIQALENGLHRLPGLMHEERDALTQHGRAYERLASGMLDECLELVRNFARSEVSLRRVSAARLAGSAASERAAKANGTLLLEIMLGLSEDEDRNVRRPLARQESVQFIFSRLRGPNSDAARTLLFERLLQDEDDIIPVTTFDLIDVDSLPPDLLRAALSTVQRRGAPEVLMERAASVERNLFGSAADV